MLKKASYILCVLLAVIFAYLIFQYNNASGEASSRLSALKTEAYPYEQELTRIKREMETKRLQLAEPTEPGLAVIGYTLDRAEDVEIIAEQAEQYGFKPVIFLAVDEENLDALMWSLYPYRRKYDFALTYHTWSDDTIEQAMRVREVMAEYQVKDTGAFLLRLNDDTPDRRSALEDVGIETILAYAEGLDNQITEKTVVLNYSYITKSDYSAGARLENLRNSERATAFIIGLEYVREQKIINTVLSSIEREVDVGNVEYSSLTDAVKAVRNYLEAQAAEIEAYEQELAQAQEQMEELQTKINDIYSNWNQEQEDTVR